MGSASFLSSILLLFYFQLLKTYLLLSSEDLSFSGNEDLGGEIPTEIGNLVELGEIFTELNLIDFSSF